MKKKIIDDLVAIGHHILYIEDYDMYYVVAEFTPYNPSDHMHNNELMGQDITDKVKNFDMNFTDTHTINTFISKINPIHLRFSKDIKWIWFS